MDVPVKWRGPTFDFSSCGNPSGVLFIYDCLLKKVEKGLPNEILVDKEIEITKGQGKLSTILNAEVTKLSHQSGRLKSEDLGNMWKYSLVNVPQIDPLMAQSLDEDTELIDYFNYSKDITGFSPHRSCIHLVYIFLNTNDILVCRFPLAERGKANLFKNPHMLPEDYLGKLGISILV